MSVDQIGPRGILSNATAGVVTGKIVYALPGSVAGVELAMKELILPTIDHTIDLLAGRTKHHGGAKH
jgi:molybdenum cofactor biosynthesis protein B